MIVIAGHPRSGTTLLARILNLHPKIAITFEFQSLRELNTDARSHWAALRKDIHRRRIVETKWFTGWRTLGQPSLAQRAIRALVDRPASLRFLLQYRSVVRRSGLVTLDVVADGYRAYFGEECRIGEKYPEYVFDLDRLVDEPGLEIICIFRDPRDVAASVLGMVRRGWRGGLLGDRIASPAGIARTWAEAAQSMLRHQDRCHLV